VSGLRVQAKSDNVDELHPLPAVKCVQEVAEEAGYMGRSSWGERGQWPWTRFDSWASP
jgi:hypothetical protein